MFGGNGSGDPFRNPFEQMHHQMRTMDHMMNTMIGDAFDMLNSFGMGMPRHPSHPMLINDNIFGGQSHRGRQRLNDADMMLSPFGFGGPFFGGMMNHMQNLHNSAMHDPNSVMVTESTMISYDGNGQPKIVQSSTRKAGDVKETRKTLRDGQREELSIGHSIGDRSHIIEKKRDKDGRVHQQQKFVNLNEAEAQRFNEQFKTKARQNIDVVNGIFGGRNQKRQQAIENSRKDQGYHGRGKTSGHYRQTDETPTPIITIPDDDEDEMPARGKARHNRYHDYEDVIYSNNGTGPTIQEIDDNDAGTSAAENPKRRKGVFKFKG